MLSDDYQTILAENGLTPAKNSLAPLLGDDEFAQATIEAASNAKLTPAAAGWASVEGARILEDLFVDIAKAATSPSWPRTPTRRSPNSSTSDAHDGAASPSPTAVTVSSRAHAPDHARPQRRSSRGRHRRTPWSSGSPPPRRTRAATRPAPVRAARSPPWSRSAWRSATRWSVRWCCRSRSSAWPSSSASPPSGSGCDNYRELVDRRLPVEGRCARSVLLPRQRRASRWPSAARSRCCMRQMSKPVRLLVQTAPAAGLGDAGAGRADRLAVALRQPVRRHQLAAHPRSGATTRATRGCSTRCRSSSSPR